MKKIILVLLVLSFINVYAQGSDIKITNSNYKHLNATWSPVEDLILFDSDMEGKRSVYIIDSNGENIKRLTSLEYDDRLAAWSPDGTQITYSSFRDNKHQIFIYDITRNTQRQLTFGEFDDITASWSPDGKQITYSSKLRGRNVREIFIIDVDGKNKKRLTHNRSVNGFPIFSTDGRRIFYHSSVGYSTNNKSDIYSYNLTTSKIEQLTYSDTGGGGDPFIYAVNKELAFFITERGAPNGPGMYWMDVRCSCYYLLQYDGKYITIIDNRSQEISIYDIENPKLIRVTDKLKINKN